MSALFSQKFKIAKQRNQIQPTSATRPALTTVYFQPSPLDTLTNHSNQPLLQPHFQSTKLQPSFSTNHTQPPHQAHTYLHQTHTRLSLQPIPTLQKPKRSQTTPQKLHKKPTHKGHTPALASLSCSKVLEMLLERYLMRSQRCSNSFNFWW